LPDLLGWLERYTLEISILRHLLNHSNVKDWQQQVARMKQNAGAKQLAEQQFRVWHEAILNSPDITEAAKTILGELERREPEA
jgi:hypothetical protein